MLYELSAQLIKRFLFDRKRFVNSVLLVLSSFILALWCKQVLASEPGDELLLCQLPSHAYQADDEQQIKSKLLTIAEQGPFRYSLTRSPFANEFPYEQAQPYSEYLLASYQKILNNNPRAEQTCALDSLLANTAYQQLIRAKQRNAIPKVVDLLAPYELKQATKNKAVLLVHGLTDSPYHFYDLAQFYYQQGFNVRTLLLPAHGTAPQDLVNVKADKWQKAVMYAVSQTLADFDNVYLGGYSLGGALVINHLLRAEQQNANNKVKQSNHTHYQKLRGIFLWSPVIEAKNKQAWLASYLNYIPGFTWLEQLPDDDFAKYESFPINAAAQVNTVIDENKALFDELVVSADNEKEAAAIDIANVPVFMVLTDVDNTIDSQSAANWLVELRTKIAATEPDTVIMYRSTLAGQAIENGVDLTEAMKQQSKVKFIGKKVMPKSAFGASSIAHTAILNAPTNSHYGVNGVYQNCNHWLSEPEKFIGCKRSGEHVGEISGEDLAKYPKMARLTFNPYFDHMLTQLRAFIIRTEQTN